MVGSTTRGLWSGFATSRAQFQAASGSFLDSFGFLIFTKRLPQEGAKSKACGKSYIPTSLPAEQIPHNLSQWGACLPDRCLRTGLKGKKEGAMQASLGTAPPPQDLPAHGHGRHMQPWETCPAAMGPARCPVRIGHSPDLAEAASGALCPPASRPSTHEGVSSSESADCSRPTKDVGWVCPGLVEGRASGLRTHLSRFFSFVLMTGLVNPSLPTPLMRFQVPSLSFLTSKSFSEFSCHVYPPPPPPPQHYVLHV